MTEAEHRVGTPRYVWRSVDIVFRFSHLGSRLSTGRVGCEGRESTDGGRKAFVRACPGSVCRAM